MGCMLPYSVQQEDATHAGLCSQQHDHAIPQSTLFNAIVVNGKAQMANFPFCTIEPNVGMVLVPDQRLDKLAEISKAREIVSALYSSKRHCVQLHACSIMYIAKCCCRANVAGSVCKSVSQRILLPEFLLSLESAASTGSCHLYAQTKALLKALLMLCQCRCPPM